MFVGLITGELAPTYLPPSLALVRILGVFGLVGLAVGGLGISVGRNVLLESSVLVCVDAVSGHAGRW